MGGAKSDAFPVCEALRAELDSMRFDPEATGGAQFGANTTLIWSDEEPCGGMIVCHGRCHQAFLDLLEARVQFWIAGAVSGALEPLWADAQRRISGWPGFRRLYLSAEDHERLLQAQENAVVLNEVLFKAADEVELVIDADGNPRAACMFRIKEDEPREEVRSAARRPWWRFWG